MTPHPAIEHLAFLLGTWRGGGSGDYPTIEDFSYVEDVAFHHVGKPFISYTQRTRDATSQLPLHSEAGYFRPVGRDRLELVLVQPSGIVEIHDGRIDGTTFRLRSSRVLTTPTAKEVTQVQRTIVVDGPRMSYRVDMAAVGHTLQHHLTASLTRID